jgi:hypothetical protein
VVFDLPKAPVVLREPDRVVEGEAKRLMNFFAALSAIEEVGLDIIQDWEEGAAGRVRRAVAVSTDDLARAGGG